MILIKHLSRDFKLKQKMKRKTSRNAVVQGTKYTANNIAITKDKDVVCI